ncbi:MAG TPA: ABC transporter substrate-binding protein [Xanthomonadaceae bacterium]|nr:ABC transporter substrate-binding protein [Xanthomonadaceae bacterium]
MIDRIALAACLALSGGGALATTPALSGDTGYAPQPGDSPREIVATHSGLVLRTLVEQRDQFRADPDALETFVKREFRKVFDREYSARLVLGRHGRGLSEPELVEFAEALADNLIVRYGRALLDFDPHIDVKVVAETPVRDGKMVRVSTEVLRRGGPPVPVAYVFHQDKDTWRVFDVIVEGVSYVQTYRNQFEEMLREQTVAEVTRKLRKGEVDARTQ